ncbi:hypothetical protein [Parabacteroides sp. Marseille-P3160]|uniref:hypothetical protein n=1 Tax=Parabacteroides sp. Marseille-P3160 TaxID=1917887 RepID=UPI0009B94407|nr:hypothetical protein [Parabacteroides sp. Marseille-P3160]
MEGMKKRTIILFVICLQPILVMHAQEQEEWTREDSIWLEGIKSGKIKLKLNDQTLKSIKSGTLISPDAALQGIQKSAPSHLPITKSFSGIHPLESLSPNLSAGTRWLEHKRLALPDSVAMKKINYKDLPPGVFVHYEPKYLPELDLPSFRIYGSDKEDLKARTPKPLATFSAEDLLRSIFWKSHRAKKRNAQKANAWKTYHAIP